MNLALVMEQAGQTDDAKAAYESAPEVWPDYVPAMQGLAMRSVLKGEDESSPRGWIDRIAIEGEGAEWRKWAREWMARER